MEMYNRAYKLDPEVENHFDGQELSAHLLKSLSKSEEDEVYNPFPRRSTSTSEYFDPELLTDIKAAFSFRTENVPEEKSVKGILRIAPKEEKCFLASLPDDILLRVLQSLGIQHLPSLESALARTCRQFYVACRQEALWTFLATKRRLKLADAIEPARLQFIKAPHFRTDGLYISKITYIRQGWEEGVANPPSFVVTYYRYLRFFAYPKRVVLALVSTDKPSVVIERLKSVPDQLPTLLRDKLFSSSSNRGKQKKNSRRTPTSAEDLSNFFIGTYWPDPSIAQNDDHPVTDLARYQRLLLFDCFAANPMLLQMDLRLGDSQRGAASKTARCFAYAGRVECFNLTAERERERVEFDVHNWGKFYFSRVKSYLT